MSVSGALIPALIQWVFWLLVLDVMVLGWLGANRPEGVYVIAARCAIFYYFFHFLIVMPLLGKMERSMPGTCLDGLLLISSDA